MSRKRGEQSAECRALEGQKRSALNPPRFSYPYLFTLAPLFSARMIPLAMDWAMVSR